MSSTRWIKFALLVLLAGFVSIVSLNYVGDLTIYSLQDVTLRERSHEQIIHNRPPAGGWSADGANATNVRIAVPYFVEFARKHTGIGVAQLYKGVDLVFMWVGFIIFFQYLQRWFTARECVLACLYLAAVMPLTFAFHSYQPWDRASFAAWNLAIWSASAQWFWTFASVTVAAVFIKYDAVVLPALYLLGNATNQNWRPILLRSGANFAFLLAIFYGLTVWLPGGFEPRHYSYLIARNVGMMARTSLFYPPVLAFGLPLVMAILGYRRGDQFSRACVWLAAAIAAILFASTNFEEVRAEQMLFPLFAPSALFGLRRLLESAATSNQEQTSAGVSRGP